MGNRQRVGLILDREQLCDALGVSDSAITAWEKKGLPTVRRGRGRGMRSLYDLDAVRAWCAKTGYGHSTFALLARFTRAEPPPAPGPAPAPVQTAGPTAAELAAMNREHLGLETALLQLPAIAARAGVAEAEIDALVAGVLAAIGAELGAEAAETWRAMFREERAAPGSLTT